MPAHFQQVPARPFRQTNDRRTSQSSGCLLSRISSTASLVLANSIECIVTAVDIHQQFLDELQTIAARDGLADRITVVEADMADPPFPDYSFDLGGRSNLQCRV